jgi:hypothetical protein
MYSAKCLLSLSQDENRRSVHYRGSPPQWQYPSSQEEPEQTLPTKRGNSAYKCRVVSCVRAGVRFTAEAGICLFVTTSRPAPVAHPVSSTASTGELPLYVFVKCGHRDRGLLNVSTYWMTDFWVVTPCSVVVRYQRFGGPFCLHLQGEVNGAGEEGVD